MNILSVFSTCVLGADASLLPCLMFLVRTLFRSFPLDSISSPGPIYLSLNHLSFSVAQRTL